MKENIFWIFGILQVIVLGFIVYFLLNNVGKDTAIVLSVLFAVFTFIVEYMIYKK